jgi:hypothetical protein
MNINTFASMVTKLEGKKMSVNVGQVKEVLAVANKLTGGLLYIIIRWKK